MSWIVKFSHDGDPDHVHAPKLEHSGIGKENGIKELSSFHNNEFSSARVKPGFRVRAFTDLHYTGLELRLDRDPQHGRAEAIIEGDGIMKFTFFPNADPLKVNDRISSFYIEEHPA